MRGKGSYLRGREEPSQREGGTFSTGGGANFLSLQIFVNSRDADSSIYDRLKKKSESYRFRSHLFTDLLTKELANLASDYLMLC